MPKAFLISLPSISVHRTLTPLVSSLVDNGFEITYYNHAKFPVEERPNLYFRAYPDCRDGYSPEAVNGTTTFFEFAEILANTSAAVIDFLLQEVNRENPELILHSHLAMWGKLLAQTTGIPGVSLYTTFILDQKFMLPYLRQIADQPHRFDNILSGVAFNRKMAHLRTKLGVRGSTDVWDAYVNAQAFNIAFIPEIFQPHRAMFGSDYRFVGYPMEYSPPHERKAIYVSMGTVFNKDLRVFHLCAEVLSKSNRPVIVSAGKNTGILEASWPENFVVKERVDQVEVLKRSVLFLTHGGMASTMEAVYTHTPMLVIPQIPEQMLTAERVEALNIGRSIPFSRITENTLGDVIAYMLNNYDHFHDALKTVHGKIGSNNAAVIAAREILDYIRIPNIA